ncbi:hypothetical protein [Rodentibacter trehalosifermentans]|uniref:hypothetical protein n=1 Tax=Rodentibacter trehalosifermentans TaxID=1908263 RepID=UPI0009849D94|nr:hypothetical protein [Rodentibacter trehalosifermentans]OOF53951.1 hypothetical protein BKK53_00025 [Rodentibacter trehalosifermentans]
MQREYDFSEGIRTPYANKLKPEKMEKRNLFEELKQGLVQCIEPFLLEFFQQYARARENQADFYLGRGG